MKQLLLVGRIVEHEHPQAERTIEIRTDDAMGWVVSGRYLLPAGLKDPRGATSYELERMLRSAAWIRGEEWK